MKALSNLLDFIISHPKHNVNNSLKNIFTVPTNNKNKKGKRNVYKI